MLVFLLALAVDVTGSLLLLRLTRRWWLLLPGAVGVGIVSGLGVNIALGSLMGDPPGVILTAAIGAAGLHAMLSAAGIFWLRWWVSPLK